MTITKSSAMTTGTHRAALTSIQIHMRILQRLQVPLLLLPRLSDDRHLGLLIFLLDSGKPCSRRRS